MKLQVFVLCFVTAASALPEGGFGSTSPTTLPFQPSSGYLPGQTTFTNHFSTTYNPGGNNIYNNQNGYNHNSYQNQKNVYFFAAPDDEQTARLRIFVEPSSRRNTKIIFIKAPGHGGVVPEIIAPPSEAVDRTLVYVLSKHQKHGGSITIPANLGIKQAKPEVYFIKYRNQHDAEGAVHQGLNGQRVGTGLDDLGNAQVFTQSLGGSRGFVADGFNTGVSHQNGVLGTNTNYGTNANYGTNSNYGTNTNYGPSSGSGPY